MRINKRAHIPWAIFVTLATAAAALLYLANFHPQRLPFSVTLPAFFGPVPPERNSTGGTPLGVIFGSIALLIFIFAALLGLRKKIPLWRIGSVQKWLRAHIWLTLLTIPLVLLHSGFRLGGPMTTSLMLLYGVVMVSGIYGLTLQHHLPRLMKERLPAETVFEQIPHIRAQLVTAAEKMRDSFKPAPPAKTDAGAPAASAAKSVTTGTAPMASTKDQPVNDPTARAKTAAGSTVTAEPVNTPAATAGDATEKSTAKPNAATTIPQATVPETAGTPTAATPNPPKVAPAAKPASKTPAAAADPASEALLADFIDRQILPYLRARRGDRMRLGNPRFSDDTFRFARLNVAEAYRTRVEEIQAWCDERRMLDVQTKMHHWLHAWLFLHVPFSYLLIWMTLWHAYVTLFRY